MAVTPAVAEQPGTVASELRQVALSPVLRWTVAGLSVLAVLGAAANAADVSVRDAANSFTSVNTAVLLALVVGVLGSTGQELSRSLPATTNTPAARRVLGAKARAYGLVGLAAAAIFTGLAAAVALPLLHSRGVPAPSLATVADYSEREAVAAARLAIVGVAIGVAVGRRALALGALAGFLVLEAAAESFVPAIRDYGPIGALNAFSDPTHHHQLALWVGSLVALAWALSALMAAALVLDRRR